VKKYYFLILPALLIAVAAVFYFFDPARLAIFPRCPFFVITGYYCPGCGSQRAIHSFLHFRWADVIHYNILVFPAVLFITYHYAALLLKRKFGISFPDILYNKKIPWIILTIVIAFWIARNIPVEPFIWLSPGNN